MSRAQEAATAILEALKQGAVAKPLAAQYLAPRAQDAPSRTGVNRLIMALAGTGDARTFRQWKQKGRWPRKGSHAIYLFRPLTVPTEKQDASDDKNDYRTIGFVAFPAFPVESTEGAPLVLNEPPDPPFLEVAASWDIDVEFLPATTDAYAKYLPQRDQIKLYVRNPLVFLHELVHAADHRLRPEGLHGGQDPEQEIVAELGAAVLAHMCGIEPDDSATAHYIKTYAGKDTIPMCYRLLQRTVAAVDQIVNASIAQRQAQAA